MKTFNFSEYQIDENGIKSGEGQIDYDTSEEYAELYSTDSKLIQDFANAFRKTEKSKYYFYGEQGELGINLMAWQYTNTENGAFLKFEIWH